MAKIYLILLIILGFGIACSNSQNSKLSRESSSNIHKVSTEQLPPKPIIPDAEMVVLLPCYKQNGFPLQLYSEVGNEINFNYLRTRIIDIIDPPLESLVVVDFFGSPRTINPEIQLSPQKKSKALCEVVFDIPNNLMTTGGVTVVNDFQEALCKIFGYSNCETDLEDNNILVGLNIAYASSGHGSRVNDPTCDKETMGRLFQASNLAQDINESDLLTLLKVDNSVPNRGAGIYIAILDSGGQYDNQAHSLNLTIPYTGTLASSFAIHNVRDDYLCEVSKINLKKRFHGTIVSKIIDQIVPNATRVMFKICSEDGECEGKDIAKSAIYMLNGYMPSTPHLVNMSFGTKPIPTNISPTGEDLLLKHFIEAMPNTLFIASAGNGNGYINSDGNQEDGSPHYSAEYDPTLPNILAVGASYLPVGAVIQPDQLERAAFSSATTNYLAPGVNTLVNLVGGNTDIYTGTSFAAPTVVGLAALYIQQNPSITNPEAIRDALKAGAITSFDANGQQQHFFVRVP